MTIDDRRLIGYDLADNPVYDGDVVLPPDQAYAYYMLKRQQAIDLAAEEAAVAEDAPQTQDEMWDAFWADKHQRDTRAWSHAIGWVNLVLFVVGLFSFAGGGNAGSVVAVICLVLIVILTVHSCCRSYRPKTQ